VVFLVVDRIVIDKVLIGGWAFLADIGGRMCRFAQVGDVQRYLAVFAIGFAVLVWIAARPATPEVEIAIEGNHVAVKLVDAEADNDDLTYSFDFDGDGTPDREGRDPSATWIYGGPDRHTISIVIRDERWHTQRTLKRDIEIRQVP
jgi:hypothetical protein